jgi:hypothetical protein
MMQPVPRPRVVSTCSLVVAAALLAACPEGPPVRSALELRGPEPVGAAPAAAALSPKDSALAEQMHERFAWVSAIQEVTIRGDVAQARALAKDFAEQLGAAGEPTPGPWRPHVDALRGELEALTHAEDLRDAGAAVARLGLVCGRCHGETQASPDLPEMPEPRQGGSVQDAMRGHQWAVDRMWEGIIGPSDERWIRGSTMFIAIPGCTATTEAGDAEGQALCKHAQSLARRGHVTRSAEGRAALYGRLLATCAGCHEGGAKALAR